MCSFVWQTAIVSYPKNEVAGGYTMEALNLFVGVRRPHITCENTHIFQQIFFFLCCYKPGTNSFQLLQNLKANMLAVVGMTKGKKGSESHTQLSKERESGKNTKKMLNEKTSFFYYARAYTTRAARIYSIHL